jgi:hypothetical protein
MEFSLSTGRGDLDDDVRIEPYSVKERSPWKGKMFVKRVLNRSTPTVPGDSSPSFGGFG